MENVEKRYERRARIKPCCLERNDLLKLAEIIQGTFTKAEVERYFRVSTTLGQNRVFSNSMEDFLNQKDLPPKITELSFWMEGWDKSSRFDKNILLDFSRYSISLSVEGVDPLWVHDLYTAVMKFLQAKTEWYWPLILLERFLIFCLTIILLGNIIISIHFRQLWWYADKAMLASLWVFLVFYDTRKIWPYANIRLKPGKSLFSRENVAVVVIMLLFAASLLGGTILPIIK